MARRTSVPPNHTEVSSLALQKWRKQFLTPRSLYKSDVKQFRTPRSLLSVFQSLPIGFCSPKLVELIIWIWTLGPSPFFDFKVANALLRELVDHTEWNGASDVSIVFSWRRKSRKQFGTKDKFQSKYSKTPLPNTFLGHYGFFFQYKLLDYFVLISIL